MQAGPPGPGGAPTRPVFSPDGFWWWDGAQWRAALSPDGLWRWDGQAWVPHRPGAMPAGGGSSAATIAITLGIAVGVIVLVSVVVIAILYFEGQQISNVFSNVAAALGSPSS